MLDQNTDRMWYVIGAVIVGAALIFIMNSTFPSLFGTIGQSFEEKVEAVAQEEIFQPRVPTETDGATPVPVPSTNILNRTNEIKHHFMFNNGFAVPKPVFSGDQHPHAATASPIAVTPGETLVFKKSTIKGLINDLDGGNYWRVSLLDASKGYVDRFVTTEDDYTYVVPEGVYYIWPSYHTESAPSILAVR